MQLVDSMVCDCVGDDKQPPIFRVFCPLHFLKQTQPHLNTNHTLQGFSFSKEMCGENNISDIHVTIVMVRTNQRREEAGIITRSCPLILSYVICGQ